MSSNAGDLGVYGFNRSDHTTAASSRCRRRSRSRGCGISSRVRAARRSCSRCQAATRRSPSTESWSGASSRRRSTRSTYPAALKDEIAEAVGEYLDTKDFRTDDKEYLLRQVYEMTDRRFALAEHLLETKPWTLFAMVEMGGPHASRVLEVHGSRASKARAGNPYETAILDYHRHVDGLIGKLLEHADDETVVFVLSDHGAKRLDGGIRINEWLRRRGCWPRSRSRTACPRSATSASTGRARRHGGRLLRARVPERGRSRAGGDDPAEYEAVPATTSPGGSPRSRTTRQPDIDGRLQAGGATRASRRASLPTSSSSSAIFSGARSARSAATRVSRRWRNDPTPTTRTTRRTACTSLRGRGSTRPGGATHLLDIAPTVLGLLEIEDRQGYADTASSRRSSPAEGRTSISRNAGLKKL